MNSSFYRHCFSEDKKEGWTVNGHSCKPQGNHKTHLKHKGSIFPCHLSIWVMIWAWKWLFFPIFVMLHCHWHLLWHHHDLDIIATALHHSRHHQKGAVQNSGKSDWWFLRYSPFCDHHLFLWSNHSDQLNLRHGLRTSFISINACHTCLLSSHCQCATAHIWLECSWPDARVLPVQVPAWDLVPASQNQSWGMPWLSALHPG